MKIKKGEQITQDCTASQRQSWDQNPYLLAFPSSLRLFEGYSEPYREQSFPYNEISVAATVTFSGAKSPLLEQVASKPYWFFFFFCFLLGVGFVLFCLPLHIPNPSMLTSGKQDISWKGMMQMSTQRLLRYSRSLLMQSFQSLRKYEIFSQQRIPITILGMP